MEINENFKFDKSEWFTANPYSSNSKELPQSPGVYLLVEHFYKDRKLIGQEVLYVGSSKCLSKRYNQHNNFIQKLRNITLESCNCVNFYFKEFENYREVEKILIKVTQAKYNKQFR